VWPAQALREAEKEAADSLGITLFELMQRAGEAAFSVARAAYPQSRRWLILCGHGNNGGDGYVVARLAKAAGIEVTLLALESDKPLPEEAGQARNGWLDAAGEIHAADSAWPEGPGPAARPRGPGREPYYACQCACRAGYRSGYPLRAECPDRRDAWCGNQCHAYGDLYRPQAWPAYRQSPGRHRHASP